MKSTPRVPQNGRPDQRDRLPRGRGAERGPALWGSRSFFQERGNCRLQFPKFGSKIKKWKFADFAGLWLCCLSAAGRPCSAERRRGVWRMATLGTVLWLPGAAGCSMRTFGQTMGNCGTQSQVLRAVPFGGAALCSTGCSANRRKRRDAKPEAKGRWDPPYARSAAPQTGGNAGTQSLRLRGGGIRPMLVRLPELFASETAKKGSKVR